MHIQSLATAMVGHDGHRGWVYYLAVRPDQRGRGHGRAMMRACETWLSARDVPKIDLMVRTENDGVLAFYKAIGYGRDDVFVMSSACAVGPRGDAAPPTASPRAGVTRGMDQPAKE